MKKRLIAMLTAGMLGAGAPAMAQDLGPAGTGAQDVAPLPPGHAAPAFALPPRDEKGAWKTPNRDLAAGEALWHLRVALNVAALGCRGVAGDDLVARYNALLTDHVAHLADASARTEALYQRRFGASWREHHDGDMTKLYNFFAQPPAQERFCSEARTVLHEAAVVEPSNLDPWAEAALQRLEAPFTSFYDAFDAYRVALAHYAQRHAAVATVMAPDAPPVMVAATSITGAPGSASVSAMSPRAVIARAASVPVDPARASVPAEAGQPPAILAAYTIPQRRLGPQE
ncbi:SPOR domain-containing protein [uncultured Sphingomonas sp.]|uniref:SPOR domain-containing protein n=1 Tax=uncultured Sphingomonas sp. TaxID=158754 RepID=UPI0035CAD5F2